MQGLIWGHRGGAGAGCRGQGRVVCQCYIHTGVQWHTEVQRAGGGLRTTVGRSRALPRPMGARRTESEAGEGARGARRASAVAFRGFNWMLTKVVHKIDALKLDKITPSYM